MATWLTAVNPTDFRKKRDFKRLIRRPEIGAFVMMVIIIVALAIASDGKAFNALGLKNNIKIIAQYGIIAIGAALLMIAGEFDLSIGSMIGFAGMSMALMLKWGLPFGLGEATPFHGLHHHAGYDAYDWLVHWDDRCAIRPIELHRDTGFPLLFARHHRGCLPPDQPVHSGFGPARLQGRPAGLQTPWAAKSSAGFTMHGTGSAKRWSPVLSGLHV